MKRTFADRPICSACQVGGLHLMNLLMNQLIVAFCCAICTPRIVIHVHGLTRKGCSTGRAPHVRSKLGWSRAYRSLMSESRYIQISYDDSDDVNILWSPMTWPMHVSVFVWWIGLLILTYNRPVPWTLAEAAKVGHKRSQLTGHGLCICFIVIECVSTIYTL